MTMAHFERALYKIVGENIPLFIFYQNLTYRLRKALKTIIFGGYLAKIKVHLKKHFHSKLLFSLKY